ncbi:MAG: TolC family protein [Calditrichaeota bacterium]|nr:TolC family protein [Calditrichota bacterium]
METKDGLTLSRALSLALKHSPQLAVFSLEIRAREAAALQAALRPNPELNVEAENVAGSGLLSGFRSTETTVSIGQLIELAGKRQKRANAAVFERKLAEWDYKSKKLDVFARVVAAFNHVLAVQEQIKLDKEILALAEEFKTTIAHRVQAGRLSPAELSRAEVETANARIALQRGQKELTAAKLDLAATWGASQITFGQAVGSLDQVTPLPDLDKLLQLTRQNPDLARWQTEKNRRRAVQALARAQAIPDPALSIGWRWFNERGDRAFVAGLSIPLPVFDRKQGAIQEAARRTEQAEWQERSSRIELHALLSSRYQMLAAARQSLKSLKDDIIPKAQQAFETINRGYRQGKFGFLDVLDARRTLFSSRKAYLKNLADYQQIRTQIERLIGQSLENLK